VFSLLDKFGLHDESNIEEKILELNSNKVRPSTLIIQNALHQVWFNFVEEAVYFHYHNVFFPIFR